MARPILDVTSTTPAMRAIRYRLKAYARDNRDDLALVSDLTMRARASFARLGIKPAEVPAASPMH